MFVSLNGAMSCSFLRMYFWFCGRDEELLGRGLELNDGLQSLLAKHDAILSGSPLPNLVTNFSPQQPDIGSSSLKPAELKETLPRSNAIPSTPVAAVTKVQAEEEEDEEDDFAQLARRYFMNNQ